MKFIMKNYTYFFLLLSLVASGFLYSNLFNFIQDNNSFSLININDKFLYQEMAFNLIDLISQPFQNKINFLFSNQIVLSFNIWVQAFVYFFFGTSNISFIIINAFIGLLIIIYLQNILFLYQVRNNYCYYFFLIILCFFPSSIHLFTINGKALYITLFTLIIIYIFIFLCFNQTNQNIKYSLLFKISFIFLPLILIFLVSMRASSVLFLLICFSTITIFFFKSINLKKLNYYYFIFFIFIILSLYLYYLLKNYLPAQSALSHTDMTFKILSKEITNNTIEWKNFDFFPSFVNNILHNLSLFRENFQNYQILSNSNSALYSDFRPTGSIHSITHIITLFFRAPLLPGFDYWVKAQTIYQFSISLESLFSYILFSSIVLNYKKLSLSEILILFFSISYMAMIVYAIPNLGSFIRYRYLANLLILLIAFKNWVIIFESLFNYFQFKKNNLISINYLNITNNSLFTLQNLLSILLSASLLFIVFFRDIFLINYISIGSNSETYLIILAILTFFQNSFSNPIVDYRGACLDNLKSSNLQIFFTYFSFLLILHLFHKDIFIIFNINLSTIDLYLFYALLLMSLITILYLAEFSYRLKLNFFYYTQFFIQLSIIFIFIIIKDLNISSILFSFCVSTLFGIIILGFISKNKNIFLNKLDFVKFSVFNLFDKTFIKIIFIQFINNIIFLIIYYLSLKYFHESTFYLFAYKIIFSIAFFISNLGSVLLLPNLLNLSDNEKNLSIQFYLKYFIIIGLLINFLIFFLSIFIQPVFYFLFSDNSFFLSHTIGQSFIICSTIIIIISLNLITQKLLILKKLYNLLFFSNLLAFLILFTFTITDFSKNIYVLNSFIYIAFLIPTLINVFLINRSIKNANNLFILILFSFLFSSLVIIGVYFSNTILLNVIFFLSLILVQSYIKKYII